MISYSVPPPQHVWTLRSYPRLSKLGVKEIIRGKKLVCFSAPVALEILPLDAKKKRGVWEDSSPQPEAKIISF